MSISNDIQNCAETVFKIPTVKPYQLLVMHRIIEQFELDNVENQIVIFPTGSGKSLCFLVPAVMCKTVTIIIYPLLALMNDQKSKLEKLGIKCTELRGGQSKLERDNVFRQIDNGTKIIITNPETLNQKTIIARLKKYKIELLIIDEAHVISQWGKSFRPAYTQLKDTVLELSPHQTIAFTATATKQTLEDIQSCLFKEKPLIVQADADRDNIYYSAYPVYSKLQGTIELLGFCQRPAIIFCNRRRLTYEIAIQIKHFFPTFEIRYYHAGLTKEERVNIENWFKATKEAVLVTTCAYGLGVDLPGIRTIIHYDLPEDALEYLQESGRAGRDRNNANAWVLVPFNEESNEGLIKIFRENKCRRQALLECLGEFKDECSGCDVCSNNVIKAPYGQAEILSFVKRYPFLYSKSATSGILSGSPFYSQHSLNPYYGTLNMDESLLEETITLMDIPSVVLRKRGRVLYPKRRKKRTL